MSIRVQVFSCVTPTWSHTTNYHYQWHHNLTVPLRAVTSHYDSDDGCHVTREGLLLGYQCYRCHRSSVRYRQPPAADGKLERDVRISLHSGEEFLETRSRVWAGVKGSLLMCVALDVTRNVCVCHSETVGEDEVVLMRPNWALVLCACACATTPLEEVAFSGSKSASVGRDRSHVPRVPPLKVSAQTAKGARGFPFCVTLQLSKWRRQKANRQAC